MKRICLLILLLGSLTLHAQDDPLDGDGTVPVDGGLTLLLAAGAAYGARRLRRHRED